MKTTIKSQALELIAKQPIKRSEVVRFIMSINGTKSTSFSGYYSTNFKTWEYEGLISIQGGKCKITSFGRKYLKDPKVLSIANAKKRKAQYVKDLDFYKAKTRELHGIIFYAQRQADLLGYDFDRMSGSGRETLLKLESILNFQ
jgi:hypothetical protein